MDWLHILFDHIKNLSGDFIVIAGNSDYCFGSSYHPLRNELPDRLPKNVRALLCQNNLIPLDHENFDRIYSLPIGIENFRRCGRIGHGTILNTGIKKAYFLRALKEVSTQVMPDKLIYSNFSIRSGCQSESHRLLTMKICKTLPYITWQDSILSCEMFYSQILRHEAVVCAQGNGPGDNHRIYETLYLNRIPITFNRPLYDRLHVNFPIICLDSPEDLHHRLYIEGEISRIRGFTFDKSLISESYWSDYISRTLGNMRF